MKCPNEAEVSGGIIKRILGKKEIRSVRAKDMGELTCLAPYMLDL